MQIAQQACKKCEVNLLTTNYPEDDGLIPEWMIKTDQLKKEMSDFNSFNVHRKLPIIREIFDRLRERKADYYIYSNVDISLQPSFYNFINEKIDNGHDAFVINRRTISKDFTRVDEYDLMCADQGDAHPGYDCFVFPASFLDDFELGNAGLGANWIGRVIISNLIVHARNFKIFKDEYLTFHIGDDRSWRNPDFADYDAHNRDELIAILLRFRETFSKDKKKLAYLNEYLYKDMKWNEDGKNPYMQAQSVEPQSLLDRIRNKVVNWLR